ncbi:hypothetical protein FRC03_009185 [Tulasnella sp. 419]|nr:hypothetical protein FRC02_009363 [Tulasnella sp. 418]KAG8958386.1 hypothetical protein FRC03_009185 [Tulasnella sp. 419]
MLSTMQRPPQSASAANTSFYLPLVSYNEIPEEYVPPSSSPGDPYRPTIELSKPVYEIDAKSPVCTVSGEIELDTGLFGSLPYSIGIAFTTPEQPDKPVEWNQDPLHTNYYRPRSFIQMDQRLVVDDTCYLKFRIDVPPSLLPSPKSRKVYTVDVRAYALSNPNIVTKPSSVQFMILNKTSGSGRRSTLLI